VHAYELETEAETYGEAVAATLGVGPERLYKTLLTMVDSRPVVAIVPVSGRLSLKGLARAASGKKAEMMPPADAERLTGYVTGGISPFGQKRRLPRVRRFGDSRPRHDLLQCRPARPSGGSQTRLTSFACSAQK
jgi:Cys-tRNA(Pro)/Cys-tRNA(Cys) deacylase